jgi:hypothetical protein
VESHNRSFLELIGSCHVDVNNGTTVYYDFVLSRGTGIAIASTANKDFESN